MKQRRLVTSRSSARRTSASRRCRVRRSRSSPRNAANVQYVALQQLGQERAPHSHAAHHRRPRREPRHAGREPGRHGGACRSGCLAGRARRAERHARPLLRAAVTSTSTTTRARTTRSRTPRSDLLYKGALYDESRAVFRGIIKVFPKAQRTDAYQTNRNLLLSEHAEATSLPNLEIEADDVRCSHAATVGHLDQEELFYIMSRGVPRARRGAAGRVRLPGRSVRATADARRRRRTARARSSATDRRLIVAEFVKAASLADVPPGIAARCRARGRRTKVCVANVEGEIYAFQDRCSHRDFPLRTVNL